MATITLTVTALAVGALTAGATADRRTAVFLTLGLGQLGVALALRSNAHGRRGTRGLERGVAGACVLLILAAYAPMLGALLDTVPLGLTDLVPAAIAATLPGILVRMVVSRDR